MSKPDEFKLWDRMPEGDVRVETPDGVMHVTGGRRINIRHNLYDESKAPMIGSGDWEVNHDHYEPSRTRTTQLRNGR
jgi:hypothetical protein